MTGRIVIPIHNAEGQLLAYAGRWPGTSEDEDTPKYKLPPGFRKALELLNLHHAPTVRHMRGPTDFPRMTRPRNEVAETRALPKPHFESEETALTAFRHPPAPALASS